MRWLRRMQREQDLERELRSDLELEAEEQRQNGLSPEEARYAAQRAFGNTTLVKEEVREMWGWIFLDRLKQDLVYASRGMRKRKAAAMSRRMPPASENRTVRIQSGGVSRASTRLGTNAVAQTNT